MNNTSILLHVIKNKHNLNNEKTVYQGQFYIDKINNFIYMNLLNKDEMFVWGELTQTQFKTGQSELLGYNIPKIINHNMNKIPNVIQISLLNNGIDVGLIYCDILDENYISLVNTGNESCKISWFLL